MQWQWRTASCIYDFEKDKKKREWKKVVKKPRGRNTLEKNSNSGICVSVFYVFDEIFYVSSWNIPAKRESKVKLKQTKI